MPLNANLDEMPDPAFEKTSILLVDDLPEKLLVFTSLLEDLGQNLVCVRSGGEALRAILNQEFAVILLDVNMPDIDGFETAALIRKYKRSTHTPIIFITSYADEMQTARGYSLGAVDYILSPVVPEVLRSKVKVFVDLHLMHRRVSRQADERVARMAAEAARHVAEEQTRRSHFLSQASLVLSDSLDIAVGMERLLGLLVPRMAAQAMLALQDGAQQWGPALRFDGDTPEAAPCEMQANPPAVLDAFARALATRQPVLMGAAQKGAVVVPLVVGDRVLGALWVVPGNEPADIDMLQELAVRAAIAFENARLYRTLEAEIVERRAAELRLQESGRRKDEFLAMLSHELRNPLAPIHSSVQVIRRLVPAEPLLQLSTEIIERQLVHLTRLVDDLLDSARISQGKVSLRIEPVDLCAAVRHGVETATPLIEARGHALRKLLPAAPVWVQGDFTRLSQVVSNLLNNAAKYAEGAGSIEVELSLAAGQAVLSVRDNGIGIPPDLLPRVFDLFEQGRRTLDRSQGGLGVGLTLVKHIVHLHQGRVEALSAGLGQGAEFRVFLPCMEEVPASSSQDSSPAEPPEVTARRILVVDDNEDAAQTTAIFLQLAGHDVVAVTDGRKALEQAAEWAPEVVVLDIGLPGLDGYEVARHLRLLPQTRSSFLIALTGYGAQSDLEKTKHAGFDLHLVKPADPQMLLRSITGWREPVRPVLS